MEKDKIERIEKEKKDVWKYCQICSFSVFNGLEFIHQKDGNFHMSCLMKRSEEKIERLVSVLKNLEIYWEKIKEDFNFKDVECSLRIKIEDDIVTLN